MITLEEIKRTLDSNINLDDNIRDSLYSLIHIFNKKYPNISLDRLNNNLKNLKIVKSNKFINKNISRYNYVTNTLEFNVEKINEGYDMKHVLMYELLQIITNNGEQVGFNRNNKFEALNAGYTEILTNNLVGNDSDVEYLESEVISTNLIALIIGEDILFNAYFNNDTELLINNLIDEGAEV